MAEKSDDATEQGCDLHQLMSDILSRARLDVFRGHGLDALGLLESAFELSTKHSVLHVYEPGRNKKLSMSVASDSYMLSQCF